MLFGCQVLPDLFVTPRAVVYHAPLSMGFSRQEYCSGLPFLVQGIFLTQGLNSRFLNWQVDSLPLSHLGSPSETLCRHQLIWCVTEFCLVRLNWKSCWDAPEIFLSDNVYPSSTLLSASWNEFVMMDSRAVILNHEYGCFMLGRMVS